MRKNIRPYKRKKGSPKQKNDLNEFNKFTDLLASIYFSNNINKEVKYYKSQNNLTK